MKMTQLQWVRNKLVQRGYVSRNECLRNYISRLSAIILKLKSELVIEGEYITKSNGSRDYVYYLIRPKKTN